MQGLTESIRNSGVLEIRNRLESMSAGKVLDIGTQHGDFISAMMKSMKNYEAFVGIDISEKDLEKARESFPDVPVEFELMNAEELSFDDDSFDTVCLSYSLHHLENVEVVLREMMRVLKPGGHLIVQELFSDDDQSEAKITDILAHQLDARLDRMSGIPHFEAYSRQQLKDIVNRLGMSRVEVYESTWPLKCLDCDNMQKCAQD
ncbi:MAG: class I SAM-dependent methyltransferase [Candidatus Thorarchaeota archaeon]